MTQWGAGTYSWWRILSFLVGSAVFWLQYIDLKDRYQPEPRKHLLWSFLLGAAGALAAFLVFGLLEWVGVPDYDAGGSSWLAVYCFGFIGPIEEGIKAGLAWLIIFRWKECDELIDGFVYAAALSLGFASLENLYHVPALPAFEQFARSAVLPLTHTLFSAVWGFGFVFARWAFPPGPERTLCIWTCLFQSMALHGLYDFYILKDSNTVAAAFLVLVLWIWVIAYARTAAKIYVGHGKG